MLGLVLSGCAFQRAEVAQDARVQMVGMSKEQVLGCMGAPATKAAEGTTEVWGFNSGNGMTVVDASYGRYGSSAVASSRFCNINIVFASGQVATVNYAGTAVPIAGLAVEDIAPPEYRKSGVPWNEAKLNRPVETLLLSQGGVMPLPSVSAEQISLAMARFDNELRTNPEWVNWEDNQSHRYAISKDNKLYPVKQIVSMATGVDVNTFSGGSEANNYVKERGFEIDPLNSHGERNSNCFARISSSARPEPRCPARGISSVSRLLPAASPHPYSAYAE